MIAGIRRLLELFGFVFNVAGRVLEQTVHGIGFDEEDTVSGTYTYTASIIVPPGMAVLMATTLLSVDAAFTAAESALIDIGDEADPNGYAAAIDCKSAGAATLNGAYAVNRIKRYPSGGVITATLTTVGEVASAAGHVQFVPIMIPIDNFKLAVRAVVD
jgi:hypothetical protein